MKRNHPIFQSSLNKEDGDNRGRRKGKEEVSLNLKFQQERRNTHQLKIRLCNNTTSETRRILKTLTYLSKHPIKV